MATILAEQKSKQDLPTNITHARNVCNIDLCPFYY